MPSSRRDLKTYIKYWLHKRKSSKSTCEFCDKRSIDDWPGNRDAVTMMVLSNMFPYSVWQGNKVRDHLMIVPKRHIHVQSEMNDEERSAMIDLIVEYEGKGYSYFIRAAADPTRTVGHIHGHLIKIG